jgi:hypothetical protein
MNFLYESSNHAASGYHMWGRVAHSLYFTVLAEQGLVGLTLFVAMLTLHFRGNRRLRRAYAALVEAQALSGARLDLFHSLSLLTRANDAAIVAYLVTGAFLSVLTYPHLWLHLGIGMVLKRASDLVLAQSNNDGRELSPVP